MKQIYRKLFLAMTSCFFGSWLLAAGHTVSVSHINAWCFNSCNGSATATVSGGTGPFTYAWTPSGGTAANATGLCAGIYTVTVIDQSDMSTATATVSIGQPTPITLNANVNSALCFGGTGSATITLTGGTAPYTYMWSPTGGNGPFLSNAPPGAYICTVTDANGCTGTYT